MANWQRLYDGINDNETTEKPDIENDEPTVIKSKLAGTPTFMPPASAQTNMELTHPNYQKIPYQLHNKYIISPLKSGFLLIDQQAAHERVLYERYLDMLAVENSGIQQSLFPKTVTLSPTDAALLRELLDEINALGFDIRELGNATFVLQGVPAELAATFDEKALIENLLEQHKNHDPMRPG